MASEETGLVLSHRLDTNNHPQLLFQDDSNSGFVCNPPNQRPGSGPDRPAAATTSNNNGIATRELTGFIDHRHRYYQTQGAIEFRQSVYNSGPVHHRGLQNWNGGNGRGSNSGSGDGSDGNEDDDDDMEGLVNSSDNKINNSSNTSGHSSEKDGNAKLNHSFGSSREVKVGSVVPSRNDLNGVRPSSSENHQQGQVGQYQNAVALVDRDGELYYSQYLHGGEGSGAGLKDVMVENGCGFSGRKDVSYSGESGDSLRAILSDPLTGALMDDAMILSCGHSFGSGGMQHVMKMKVCYTCSHPVSEGSVASNLSLRSAVLAFRREEELQVHHASKRRRERLEQNRVNYGDSMFMDTPRGRGLQFPFSVADRVIIKGNKRTPERFVGCEAVVTTQCLNGWYVVKTLDNAESIKLQYRSLAKVSDDSSSHPTSSKTTPNWL
ncbi:hypothetical protein L6452_05319 [Arctium lappa]|uniref:Uncharacterized protein n=1 Tax=Arctium lappa TaxID=4217 RepID=A0ACB9EGD6_ARCLA|nr:hypothetical protein L6452_05319 [Arctium lappa]